MRTLGIIGGMSPESTISYYQGINQLINQQCGRNHSAPLVLISVEFEQIVNYQKSGQWQQAGELLAQAALTLEQSGAEAILLATNTMHKVAPQIMEKINIPFLHIIDVTSQAIQQNQLQKVGLLGTKFTMSDHFYRDKLLSQGITPLIPDEQTQDEIHRIIFEELCVGKILPSSKQFYLDTTQQLKNNGAEGIILGCTEIGLLIDHTDSNLPFFDTAQLHIQAAAKFILNQ